MRSQKQQLESTQKNAACSPEAVSVGPLSSKNPKSFKQESLVAVLLWGFFKVKGSYANLESWIPNIKKKGFRDVRSEKFDWDWELRKYRRGHYESMIKWSYRLGLGDHPYIFLWTTFRIHRKSLLSFIFTNQSWTFLKSKKSLRPRNYYNHNRHHLKLHVVDVTKVLTRKRCDKTFIVAVASQQL